MSTLMEDTRKYHSRIRNGELRDSSKILHDFSAELEAAFIESNTIYLRDAMLALNIEITFNFSKDSVESMDPSSDNKTSEISYYESWNVISQEFCHYAWMFDYDLSLCTFSTGDPIKSGSVYSVFEGTFANYRKVLFKQARYRDKRTVELVKTDVSMMQELTDSQHIAKIFHINTMSTGIINTIVQRYDFNLLQYLGQLTSGRQDFRTFDEPSIFRQVFTGLNYMHEKSIAHRDVQLKNAYIHIISETEWCIKLGGLKYAKKIDDEDWTGSSDATVVPPEKVDACKLRDYFQDDKFQVVVMLYFYVTRSYSRTKFGGGFVPDWEDVNTFDYKRLHAKHLVTMIQSDPSLSISDVLCHPYFMTVNEIVAFEDRLRTYSSMHREMDAHLEKNKSVVFEGAWTNHVDPEVVSRCKTKSASELCYVGLWQARRNRRQHRDEDSEIIRDKMGPLLIDNFEYWEKRFPAFFLYLFTKVVGFTSGGTFLYATKEFKNSVYFPASPAFYALCANTEI